MVSKKVQIRASAGVLLCLIVLALVDANLSNLDDYPSKHRPYNINPVYYIICDSLSTIVYSIIVLLYISAVPGNMWKLLTGLSFLGALQAVVALTLIVNPRETPWYFLFGITLIIDFTSILIFISLVVLWDTDSKFIASESLSIIGLYILISKGSPTIELVASTVVICTVIYFINLWLYVKRVSTARWKFAVVGGFLSIIICIMVLYGKFLFPQWYVLFYLMLAVDTCLIAVYTLCIYVPKLEDLVQVYFELEMAEKEEDNLLETVGLPTRFLFRDIKEATRNFHVSIGEGGSGAIFKGMIRDGTVVAVKQIKGQPSRETEFMTELRVIASLQHINLVRLLGYCLTRRGDRYLIYPFYENGSLDAWLFAGEEKRRLLTWRLRYQIAIDVAKALKYMHYDCLHMILHRDVKPANILLNGEFQALVSDFGISKLVGRYESSVRTKAKGTFTYMSPEVVTHGAISIKSDVYSYGMVLMELVAGRRNNQPGTYGENQQRCTYFLKIAREKLVEGKLIEVADKTLVRSGGVTEEELAIVVKVALWCIQDRPEQRPSMTDIVEMLQKRRSVDLPPRSPIQILSYLDVSYSIDVEPQDQAVQMSANPMSNSLHLGR
ncbi:hypothetical protein LUZ63_013192 [Rhynchospora breviuscula]|uniref:Protein kinase domain-containing protein n=1 Tax=Rhynchospora breviuscula TaxID=2022672 RepID=A0A9Q0HJZ2_9POAL|nr:hypothetical protein LUZ63_013192 [Rhynchospora breviuscula]